MQIEHKTNIISLIAKLNVIWNTLFLRDLVASTISEHISNLFYLSETRSSCVFSTNSVIEFLTLQKKRK